MLLSLPVFASAMYSSSYGPNSIYNDHVHEWEEATLTDPMTCSICGETQGEPRHLQWNDPIGDDSLSVGYYRNSPNDRYWIEIKMDGYPIEVLIQLLKDGDWSKSYGLYNKSFYEWVGKLDNYTDTAYQKGNITYFEDTATGWGHWLVWMDMDSEDQTVVGLANNKRSEIETFIRGTVACETMAVGSKGISVEELQQQLIDLGYLTGLADGDFGNGTQNAVTAFQKDVGLPVTGIVDYDTYEALFSGEEVKTDYSDDIGYVYDDIMANPDDYTGERLSIEGTVLQVIKEKTELRVKDSDGNVFYCFIPDGIINTRIIQDDNVTISGLCDGLFTYSSILGNTITVVKVAVEEISIR